MEVKTVDVMTCNVDCFGPKPLQSLVFIKHGSRHLYQVTVLHLNHSIWLRNVGVEELMLDSSIIEEILHLGVLELRPFVVFHLYYILS